jgi:hypothetical protein
MNTLYGISGVDQPSYLFCEAKHGGYPIPIPLPHIHSQGVFLVKSGLKVREFRFKNPHLSDIILLSDMVDGQPIKIGGQKGVGIYGKKRHQAAEEARKYRW